MILDVGCGSNPRGDVNVDLFLNTLQEYDQKSLTKTKVDVLADGNHLPFKTNSFDKVISHHTIEHTSTPFKFLQEIIRVSKKDIEVICPHRLSCGAKRPFHVVSFNRNWFLKSCRMLKLKNIDVKTSLIMFKFWKVILPLVWPYNLIVKGIVGDSRTKNIGRSGY